MGMGWVRAGAFAVALLLAVGCATSSTPSAPTAASNVAPTSPPSAAPRPSATASPLAAASPVAAAASAPAPAGPAQKIRVVWAAKVANMAPAWVAQEAGYFKEQGLEAELSFVNGSPAGMAALLSGDADFLQAAGTATVTAAAGTSESDKRPELVIGTVNNAVFKLMVHSDVTSVDQLKGKTLCISRPGTADEVALRLYLQRNRYDPNKDMVLFAGGSLEGCVAAMEAQKADAFMASTPLTALLEQRGYRSLVDFAREKIQLQQLGVSVTQGYARAHPDTVTRFTKAYVEALHRFKVDKAFAEQVMGKYLELADQAQLDDAWQTYRDAFEQVPIPSDESIQNVIDTVPQAKGMAPSTFVDPRFVRDLEQSGFIKSVYGS